MDCGLRVGTPTRTSIATTACPKRVREKKFGGKAVDVDVWRPCFFDLLLCLFSMQIIGQSDANLELVSAS